MGEYKVIDYTKEDFTQSDETYDIVFDAVDKISSSQGKKPLKKAGIYLNVRKDSGYGSDMKAKYLIFLKKLIEEGKIRWTSMTSSKKAENSGKVQRDKMVNL